jgi:heme/copper-type cytochrome/quinol oxidase subunit 4
MTHTKSSLAAAVLAVVLTALAFQQVLTGPIAPASPAAVQLA